MATYRVNVNQSFDWVLEKGIISAPIGVDEPVDMWSAVETIVKGDILLLCHGYKQISAIAAAASDQYFSDLELGKASPQFRRGGFRCVNITILKILWQKIEGPEFFGSTVNIDCFKNPRFCVPVEILADLEFGARLTKLF